MNKNLSGSLFSGKPLQIKETALSAQIAEYLDLRKIYNDRLNSGMIRTDKHFVKLCKDGTPDRFCIYRGKIIFIEVKVLGEKPKPNQLARHQELIEAGAVVLVVDSFENFLSQFKPILLTLSI